MASRVRLLANCPSCFKPTPRADGVKWKRPIFSAMQIAKLRKTTILAGFVSNPHIVFHKKDLCWSFDDPASLLFF
jgi:hypothetical protein